MSWYVKPMKRAALSLMILAACGSKKPSPPNACDTTGLAAWLKDLADEGIVDSNEIVMTQKGLLPVELDEAPARAGRGPIVTITQDEVSFRGAPIADPRDPTSLAQKVSDALTREKATDGKLLVQMDAGIPWDVVARVMAGAEQAGDDQVTLLFMTKKGPRVAPPGPSAIDPELAELDRVTSLSLEELDHDPKDAKKLDELMKGGKPGIDTKVFARCPQVAQFQQSLQNLTPEEIMAREATELPKAIAACGCAVDMPSVKTLAWRWFGHRGPRYIVAKTIRLSAQGKSVNLPADMAWKDAASKLLEAAQAGPLSFPVAS
jgi:biopolymer transport protein ExbD